MLHKALTSDGEFFRFSINNREGQLNFWLHFIMLLYFFFFKTMTTKRGKCYLELDNSASFPELRQGVFIKLLEIFVCVLLIVLEQT